MEQTSYEEFLIDIISIIDDGFQTKHWAHHLIVFDVESGKKRSVFNQAVTGVGWRRFQEDFHQPGDNTYDYVSVDSSTFTPLKLYGLLKQHNRKILLFDNDNLFKKKGLVEIIEGGMCSSPDSGDKWPVRLYGKPEFYFYGNIIILTGLSSEIFQKKKKYFYLYRDCLKA